MGIKHHVPDRVKPSFVIFDIRALRRSALSVRVPGYQKLHMTDWHRMLYSCTHMTTVGVKGLITCDVLLMLLATRQLMISYIMTT